MKDDSPKDKIEERNMTIQEAIKSGKEIKRPSMFVYLHVEDNMLVFSDYKKPLRMNEFYFLFVDDAMADDWEIKP